MLYLVLLVVNLAIKRIQRKEMNVPKSLLFLRDTPVAIALSTMGIIFIITCLFAGDTFVREVSGGKKLVYVLLNAIHHLYGQVFYIILQRCTYGDCRDCSCI